MHAITTKTIRKTLERTRVIIRHNTQHIFDTMYLVEITDQHNLDQFTDLLHLEFNELNNHQPEPKAHHLSVEMLSLKS